MNMKGCGSVVHGVVLSGTGSGGGGAGGAVHGFPPSDLALVQSSQLPCSGLYHTGNDRFMAINEIICPKQQGSTHFTKDQQNHSLFIRCLSQAINQERQWLQPPGQNLQSGQSQRQR